MFLFTNAPEGRRCSMQDHALLRKRNEIKRKQVRALKSFDRVQEPGYPSFRGSSVTCSATDTRLAGTRWTDPRRGGDLFGDFPRPSSIDTPEDRRRSTVRRRPDQSPWEEALATSEAVGGGETPLEGEKLKGGSSHTRCLQRRRPRTFAECIAREASEAASAIELTRPFEPTPGG